MPVSVRVCVYVFVTLTWQGTDIAVVLLQCWGWACLALLAPCLLSPSCPNGMLTNLLFLFGPRAEGCLAKVWSHSAPSDLVAMGLHRCMS